MKISIDRNEEWKEVNKIKVQIGESQFVISVNKFDELTINKSWGFGDDSTIKIIPNVSNEIKIV